VFENRAVLKNTLWPKRVEVREELQACLRKFLYLYALSTIIQVIKQRTMLWAEDVTRLGERCLPDFVGKPEGKDHLEDAGIYVTLILIWIFKQ